MLKIAYHPSFTHPLPPGHRFPMEKYELLHQQLLHEAVVDQASFFEPEPASPESIALAHSVGYVQDLIHLRIDAKMQRRIGFPLSQGLVDRERYIVEGTIQGSLYAMDDGIAFNLAGGTHHAGKDFGEGFCLFNDQAVAAAYLLEHQQLKRIAMIDLDVHQGNGTAHIFAGSQKVFTFSLHAEKNYPFIKEQSTRDVGLADGTQDEEYLSVLELHLKDIFQTFDPQFVYYQAGVDVLETDKLGRMAMTPQGCRQRDELVFEYCRLRNVPVQVSMGGGYSTNIKDIVNTHTQTYKSALKIFNF